MSFRSNKASPVEIDILVEAGDWPSEDDLLAIAEATLSAAAETLELKIEGRPELSLVFTDDAHIRALNTLWRKKDKPTNVLSFPVVQATPQSVLPPMLGDIVLAQETVAREAESESKPFDHHLAHLIVHGFLHLLGHDHEEEEEAVAMETAERAVLEKLAIPDPYR